MQWFWQGKRGWEPFDDSAAAALEQQVRRLVVMYSVYGEGAAICMGAHSREYEKRCHLVYGTQCCDLYECSPSC